MPANLEMLTPPEVARELRVRQSKVLTWVRSGRLPAVNLSEGQRPRYRIARQALDEFLQKQAVAPEAKPARRQRRDATPRYV